MRVGIVGCGPVGAWTAWKLAEKGNDVTVFEQKMAPGGKVCSGLISERLWDFVPKSARLVQNEITQIKMHFPKHEVLLELQPKMMVIDRTALDRYVADLADRAGAKIEFNSQFTKLFSFRGNRLQVTIEAVKPRPDVQQTRVYEFDYLIGADGAASQVRRQAGLPEPHQRLGLQAKVLRTSKGDSVDVWPIPGGFNWAIPRGGQIEYGTMAPTSTAAKEWRIFRTMKHIKEREARAAMIPMARLPIRAVTKRVALVGDAAGLTKPWSGGGVIWGLSAAKLLVERFPNLSAYSRALDRKFAARLIFGSIVAKLVERFYRLVPKKISIDSDWIY
jgi:geranylgeranyl reductase family protein